MEKRQLHAMDGIKENTLHMSNIFLSYVKKIGSVAYVSILTEKRQKLDDKARKLVFVGYEKGTKGYRLLDVNTNRIQVSKDVTFLERDPHSSKETQCDGDLVEDQLSEADEEDATC